MTKRFTSLPPHERAAFLAKKENHFLQALARELDALDPILKYSAPCFQEPKSKRRGGRQPNRARAGESKRS